MSVVTSIETGASGAVVVKRATAPDADRLRLEGERLRRASHPGVVAVVASVPAEDGWELRTAHAGRPLSILEPLSVRRVAALAAALASTVADLHAIGVVHGRLDASHVLVADHGRPVLCGFGDGSAPARREDDVAAMGALLGDLLGADGEPEPIPDRRWRGRRTWTGWERRALLLLADQAGAEPPTRRPSARRLAAAIAEAVPAASPDDTKGLASPQPPDPLGELDPIETLRASALVGDESPPGRPLTLVLAVIGAGLLVAGALRFGDGAVREQAVPLADAPSTVSTPSPTTASITSRTSEAVAGSVLTVAGRRYRVGQAGDEVLVGDWACDGTSTPALLRPSTSEVFVFPRWADAGPLSVEPVLLVPGGEALVSAEAVDACPTLQVRTASGALVPVIDGARS